MWSRFEVPTLQTFHFNLGLSFGPASSQSSYDTKLNSLLNKHT